MHSIIVPFYEQEEPIDYMASATELSNKDINFTRCQNTNNMFVEKESNE